jgi:hypothetical protein
MMKQHPKQQASDLVEYRRNILLTKEPSGWWPVWNTEVFNQHPVAKEIVPWVRERFYQVGQPRRAKLYTSGNALLISWCGCPRWAADDVIRYLVAQYQLVLDDMEKHAKSIASRRFKFKWPAEGEID